MNGFINDLLNKLILITVDVTFLGDGYLTVMFNKLIIVIIGKLLWYKSID